jgi:hypothetical protein
LPATNLRDLVKKIEVQDAAWRPPIIPDTQLEDHGVLPIGVRMKKGSAGTIYPGEAANSPIRDKYLYVWGRMTYDDGFDPGLTRPNGAPRPTCVSGLRRAALMSRERCPCAEGRHVAPRPRGIGPWR